uniref:Uncharacterized protein n=1 Tax=Micrurus lemniscatus lemniscatus TaxID=129467 RepID=A0A2D4IZP8_MICLE
MDVSVSRRKLNAAPSSLSGEPGHILRIKPFHVGDSRELEGYQEAASAMPEQCTGRPLPGVRQDIPSQDRVKQRLEWRMATEGAGWAENCQFLNFLLLYILKKRHADFLPLSQPNGLCHP